METIAAPPNPQAIMQFTFGFIASSALRAALEVDLFEALADGPRTPQELAEALHISARGARPLALTLVSMGLLHEQEGKFALNATSRAFLLKSSPHSMAGMTRLHLSGMALWERLGEAVRSGAPPIRAVESDDDGGSFFSEFVDGLFVLNAPAAQAVAQHIPQAQRALDIGCGSAVWSLALAQKFPQLEVTALDRGQVLETITRNFVERLAVQDRYTLKAGNFREIAFEEQHYDVAYLGHILHSEGASESAVLLRRLRLALRSGGVLVIAEMVGSDPRGQDLFPNLFDLNMLFWTEDGCVFSRSELEKMVTEAGFSRFEWLPTASASPTLLAYA